MTNKSKYLLIGSLISCTLVIVGILISHPWLTLICFLLHNAILLCLISNLSDQLADGQAKKEQDIPPVPMQNPSVSESIREIDRLNTIIETLHTELDTAQKQLADSLKQQEQLEQELNETNSRPQPEPMPSLNEYESLLPALPSAETDDQTIDIIQLARDTVDELADFTRQARIQVQIATAEEQLLVKASHARMYIMFRNIIDNSIKYMRHAGNLTITISSISEDIFIVLKDNGNGLSADETKHIFELNYQGSNRVSGNGLGLTQAKAIVEYYGGTIYAKSNIGQGMAVYIQIPTT